MLAEIVVLKCKKMFLFEKSDKNVQFNSVSRKFLKFLFVSICVRVRQVAFYLRTEKVIRLKQCPLYGFRFINA